MGTWNRWMWTRRKLLRGFGAIWGSLLVGTACRDDTPEPAQQAPDLLLRRALRKHFHYLSISEDVIAAFARDLTRNQGPWFPATSPRPYTRFLASTDFFQNGADEHRPLRYVRYYDPYVSSCYNPFSATHMAATSARGTPSDAPTVSRTASDTQSRDAGVS